eukprot:COSAG02_NODE_2942_length_7692_cov_3.853154_2_plen_45_part_00
MGCVYCTHMHLLKRNEVLDLVFEYMNRAPEFIENKNRTNKERKN